MRNLDPSLAAHLAAGVTTLCRCWKLTRSDGTVLGFTDHDRALSFDATDFEPASGFDTSEDAGATGFAIGGSEVSGALSSDRLAADDLAAGLYDNAEVRAWLVNWQAPEERHLLRAGHLGEVTHEDGVFRAEIRGPAAALDEQRGRIFAHGCDADLGDARCGIDLTSGTYRGTGTVTAALDRRRFTVAGLDAFAARWFERGRLAWTGGANEGRAAEVRVHAVGDAVTIELWQPAHHAIAAGDVFMVTAGCDKLFATCRAKFDNAENFRGFPHMPGNDFALTYARAGDRNDGSALVE
jgi:uncharacterized phage protein (TIGR02218 family)